MKLLDRKSNLALLLNIVAALYLAYVMPQHILADNGAERLKIMSVICVDICAAFVFIFSLYRIISRVVLRK